MIDESDFEILELETEEAEESDQDAFAVGRLLGVALAGAMVSLGAYYLYQQLEPEKRAKLKRQARGMIAEQIHALTDVGDYDE